MGSIWTETVNMPEFPTLEKDLHTDVLIIGGGMAGILCAYFLQQAGVDYCLLEADRICRKITGHTTAKITVQQGLIYEKLLGSLGQERAAMFLRANEKAVYNFKHLSGCIDCDMETVDSYIYAVSDRWKLENELQALASLGALADFVEKTALPFEIAGAVRYRNQAQFHPLKFAAGIAKNLKIYEHSEVREMTEYLALTKKGSVTAEKIIIATHFPFINTRGSYYLKMYQQRSHVIALEQAPDLGGIYLAAEKDGYSLRNYRNYLLLGDRGGRTGRENPGWEPLRTFAGTYFPRAQEKYFWANQDCMSLDGRAYIGPYSKNTPDLFVASGFCKWGMTGAMLSAMILKDLVQEKENEFAELFSPSRNMLKPQLVSNLGHALKGWLTFGKGKRCSHLGCTLHWNEKEKTWDCPCHGSRFGIGGQRMENPATDDLKKEK